MKKTKMKLGFFILSVVLSVALTVFSLYTVSLLFPLVQGIINGNFDNVKDLKIVGNIVAHYPDFFSTSLRLFILLVVWVYVTMIIKSILQYGAFLSVHHQAKNATTRMRAILLDKCLSFGKGFYDTNKISQIHSTLMHSTSAVERQLRLFLDLFIQLLLLTMYVGVMVYMSWKLTLISMIIFPVMSQMTKKIISRINTTIWVAEKSSNDLSDVVMNILYCMPLVKGFVKEKYEKKLFDIASNREVEDSFKVQKLQNLIGPIEDVGATTGTLFLAFGMALVLYFDKTMNSTQVFVFFYLAIKINPGLNALNNFRMGISNTGTEVRKILHVLELSNGFVITGGDRILHAPVGDIEFRNLSFSYVVDGVSVLKDVTMNIRGGKMTAIVGQTGSGKSTIANLLLRFYDCPSNSIFVNGIDIREYDVDSVRRHISFVSQDVLLFNDTIKHNITYARHDEVDEAELVQMTQKTSVHGFVSKLPDGYKTVVSERGSNFSGGEKQRISIARALFKKSDILILDEATSSLDSVTESGIIDTIEELKGDKTLIVISHRFSTIQKADHIVYLDQGRVVESGSPEELIAKKGMFYKQWMQQQLSV